LFGCLISSHSKLGAFTTVSIIIQNTDTTNMMSSVSFSDTLPTGVYFIPSSFMGSAQCGGALPVVSSNGQTLTLTGGGPISPSATCTFTGVVNASTGGTYFNPAFDVSSLCVVCSLPFPTATVIVLFLVFND
jgi:uncharacterized repeat protein (TIGR01451 family)